MADRIYHPNLYPVAQREDRDLSVIMRDLLPALIIFGALAKKGFRAGRAILNYPPKDPSAYVSREPGVPAKKSLIHFDESILTALSLIVHVGRPPLSDLIIGCRKIIKRSFTTLEHKLLMGPVRKWFESLSRPEVVLTEDAANVSPEIRRRKAIELYTNKVAAYKSVGSGSAGEWKHYSLNERPTKSPAFLIYQEGVGENGWSYLNIFGMSSLESLVWAHKLETEFPHLLCTSPFVMAELTRGKVPTRPQTTEFCDSWGVEILGAAKPASARTPRGAPESTENRRSEERVQRRPPQRNGKARAGHHVRERIGPPRRDLRADGLPHSGSSQTSVTRAGKNG